MQSKKSNDTFKRDVSKSMETKVTRVCVGGWRRVTRVNLSARAPIRAAEWEHFSVHKDTGRLRKVCGGWARARLVDDG